MNRRSFIACGSAGVTLAVMARAVAERSTFSPAAYERALIIDAMGTIGDPDATAPESPPSFATRHPQLGCHGGQHDAERWDHR